MIFAPIDAIFQCFFCSELLIVFRLIFNLLFMANVKQIAPITIKFEEASSPTDQPEEGETPVVEMETALVTVKRLCVVSVSDNAMSMVIFINLPSDGASSNSNLSRYSLGLIFLKETPPQMPHYFPIDLH